MTKQKRNKTKFSHIKSMDYALFREELRKARKDGYDEAVLLNRYGELVEGTTKAGKKFHKCSTQKYDFATRTTSGCDFVDWKLLLEQTYTLPTTRVSTTPPTILTSCRAPVYC